VGISCWSVLTLCAFYYFWRLDATPGAPADPPLASATHADPRHSTLLLFLYPECSCSRATLTELQRAAANVTQPTVIRVYFIVQSASDTSWLTSPLYALAAHLPNVRIQADIGGVEANRYGVETSGQVVVYRPDGSLAYQGGVTGSRGHEGDNPGKSRLIEALNNPALLPATTPSGPGATTAPVYGCNLPPHLSRESGAHP
jgi:hypothetical protein